MEPVAVVTRERLVEWLKLYHCHLVDDDLVVSGYDGNGFLEVRWSLDTKGQLLRNGKAYDAGAVWLDSTPLGAWVRWRLPGRAARAGII